MISCGRARKTSFRRTQFPGLVPRAKEYARRRAPGSWLSASKPAAIKSPHALHDEQVVGAARNGRRRSCSPARPDCAARRAIDGFRPGPRSCALSVKPPAQSRSNITMSAAPSSSTGPKATARYQPLAGHQRRARAPGAVAAWLAGYREASALRATSADMARRPARCGLCWAIPVSSALPARSRSRLRPPHGSRNRETPYSNSSGLMFWPQVRRA